MCGINGYFGNFDLGLIGRMNGVISHRGPDDKGEYFDREHGLALGHLRLSIVDLTSAGHQPMISSCGRVAMVYNGEMYNFTGIKSKLERLGHVFKGHSDSEVLLNAFLEWGTDCFKMFNGIFSVAFWDKKKKSLILARDGMGVKPLYIGKTPKGIIFSSEMKAILCERSFDRTLNFTAVAQHLTFLYAAGGNTVLKNVNRLAAGSFVEYCKNKEPVVKSFYNPPYGVVNKNISEADAVSSVRTVLKTAVERQMVADVEVGAFLSGGLDSSSIVAFARDLVGKPLNCFTIDYNATKSGDQEMVSDLPYARMAAKALDVNLHEVSVGPEMINRLPEMIYHLDEPVADPAILNALFISELAQKNGIKVLLSGAGGDDIFTGYRRHLALSLEKYWAWLPQSARGLISKSVDSLSTSNSTHRRIRKLFQYASLSGDERIISYFYWLDPSNAINLLSPDVRHEVDVSQISAPFSSALKQCPDDVPDINKMLDLEMRFFLGDHNLNYTDKMSMACGVEARVPFLDRDLIKLASELPLKYKQRGKIGKWVLKEAMRGILPGNIIDRPKTGFGVPLRSWMQGGLKERIQDLIMGNTIKDRGVFDYEMARKLLQDTQSGKVDGTYSLLGILCQELWCQQFIDKPMPTKVHL